MENTKREFLINGLKVWATPTILAVTLPAHAQMSPDPNDSGSDSGSSGSTSACGAPLCMIPDQVLGNGIFGALVYDADQNTCSGGPISFSAPANSFLLFDNNADGLVLNTDPGIGWTNDIADDFVVGGAVGQNATENFEATITRTSDGAQFRVCFTASRELGGASDPTGTISNIVISSI